MSYTEYNYEFESWYNAKNLCDYLESSKNYLDLAALWRCSFRWSFYHS